MYRLGKRTAGRRGRGVSHPHLIQEDRDQLDDHNLIDTTPAGDDPEEIRTAPGIRVLAHSAGTAHTYKSV